MSTLLFKTIRSQRFNFNRAIAIMKHDLLLDPIEKRKSHRIIEKSHLNTYIFRGRELNTDIEKEKAMSEIEKLVFSKNSDLAPNFDPKLYSRIKHKLKKWGNDDSKCSPEEKHFFLDLVMSSEQKKQTLNFESLLEKLEGFGKIKRFNDKKRALENFVELHNERYSLPVDSSSRFNTGVEHVIFKVPSTNAQILSGSELEAIINRYYAQHFPDYPILLSVVHRDEDAEHAHLTVHAQNQKTLEYDFVQKQYEFVRGDIKQFGELPTFYRDIKNTDILKAVGEALQSRVYEFTNKQPEVRRNNITFKLKEYSDAKHKELERKIIKLDTSKRIADREYNTANYLAQKKQELEKQLIQVQREMFMASEYNDALEEKHDIASVVLEDKLQQLNDVEQKVSKSHEKVTYNEDVIKQQEQKISHLNKTVASAKKAYKDLLYNAALYAEKVTSEALSHIRSGFKILNKDSPELLKEAHHQAHKIQPNDKQKRDIDDAYEDRFKP